MAINNVQTATTTIQLTTHGTKGYTHAEGLTEESAKKVSELLTINHTLYHTRFNAGFHSASHQEFIELWLTFSRPHRASSSRPLGPRGESRRDREFVSIQHPLSNPN